jgi:hypothetical protein
MIKQKYLHRKYRKYRCEYGKEFKRSYKGKNVDLLNDDLPFHSSMSPYKYNYGLDISPMYEFIKSKVNCNWDNVYSEILTKIDNKYRWKIDSYIFNHNWVIRFPIYDDNMIPRDDRGCILSNTCFVDYNNIIRKKSREEILSDSIRLIRMEKLKQIYQSD